MRFQCGGGRDDEIWYDETSFLSTIRDENREAIEFGEQVAREFLDNIKKHFE